MTETYFPFDAGAGSSITEDQWRKMARFWLRTGILRGELNSLAPTANGSGMQVFVDTGRAFLEGHFYENDASKTLAIGAADPTNPRIDRVVLRLDTTANTIGLAILAGTPGVSPAAPARSWGSTVFEFPVAQVRVDAAAVTIASNKVTDERVFTNVGLDRIDMRTAVDSPPDVDLRRTGAGLAQLDASLDVVGAVRATSTDHYLGPNAMGGSGSRLHVNADTSQTVVLAAEASGANSNLIFTTKGTGGFGYNNAGAQDFYVNGTGQLQAGGADHYLGAYAFGLGTGVSRLHLSTDAGSVYFTAEGDGANRGMVFQLKGSANFQYLTAFGSEMLRVNASNFQATQPDHYFGPYALSTGTGVGRLHLTSTSDGSYLVAEGDGANRDMVYRTKGTGQHVFQNAAGSITGLAVTDQGDILAGLTTLNRLSSSSVAGYLRLPIISSGGAGAPLFAPASGEGVMAYNPSDDRIYVFNGSIWRYLALV